MKIFSLPIICFLLLGVALSAQDRSCVYRLELYDTGGDGWNGAFLTFIDGNRDTTIFTLDGINDDGAFRAFDVAVNHRDTVGFFFTRGSANNQISYAIFNPDDVRVFANGPNPIANTLFTAIVSCPGCFSDLVSGQRLVDIRAFTAQIAWDTLRDAAAYLVRYNVQGAPPDASTLVRSAMPAATLRNLQENTPYQFFLAAICADGDTTAFAGPFSFRTLWANDVGIIDISTPQTACGLSPAEVITVTLKNFGGSPQSLIPFKYSVNGEPAGIPIPVDGLFTGVLGKDSTFTIEFKTNFDLSEPGEYVIQAWTELERESNPDNDTTTITVIHIPIIEQYPYQMDFETWSGGWTVDTGSVNSSWAFGAPRGPMLNTAASGQNAWVTNLTGNYNNSEISYLLSPCMDFSVLAEDPRIAFSLYVATEACCDRAWLEMSLDGGATWSKVGTAGTGINWYNNAENNVWSGTGGFTGWTTASNILNGSAGQSDVRLRFAFTTNGTIVNEGIGIDDIFIFPPLARDLATLSATTTAAVECGSEEGRVTMTISNFGTSQVTGFNVGYRVNNGPPVVENVGALSLMPGAQSEYTFNTPFPTTMGTNFNVVVWTTAPGELFPANDTARFSVMTAMDIPFVEDFENGFLPMGWSANPGTTVSSGHGNTSFVIANNLSSANRRMEVVTPALGPIEPGDSLRFDYRLVNVGSNAAIQLSANDSILVEISLDCGQTYETIFTINQLNHTPSTDLRTIVLYLDDYAGEVVKFRLRAFWGAGNYWVDFDNFNIIRCPPSFDLITEVINESVSGANDGRASVSPAAGATPFTYQWSDGSTDRTAVRLPSGNYSVTVTDRFGCTDVANVTVGLTTSTSDPKYLIAMTLAPNPTRGEVLLQASFAETADVQVQVFNLSGQLVLQALERSVNALNMPLDMHQQPAGMYLVRLLVNQQVYTEKLIKTTD